MLQTGWPSGWNPLATQERNDAEQVIEHLLKAVGSMPAADMIVRRAPVKCDASQGHVERAVRLVENPYRAVLVDVLEKDDSGGRSNFCGISLKTETLCVASQLVPTTQRRSTVFCMSHQKSMQISHSSVVCDGRVLGAIGSKTWRSSRGKPELWS